MVCLFAAPALAAPRFGSPSNYMVDGSPVSLAFGDLGAGSGPDLLVGNESGQAGPSASILLNRDNGTFLPESRTSLNANRYVLHAATSGNFDSNQPADVAIAADEISAAPLHSVVLSYLNQGDAIVGAPQTYPLTGVFPRDLVAHDLNGDGFDEIVVSDSSPRGSGQINLLRAVGDGTFTIDAPILVGNTPSDILADDIDADGLVDLVVFDATRFVYILYGMGNFSFSAPIGLAGAASPAAFAIMHDAGRSLADLVVATPANALQVLRQSQPRQFETRPAVEVEFSVEHMVSADFNGDGKADVVLGNRTSPAMVLWYGAATPSFIFGETVGLAGGVNDLVASDLNADQKPDVALISATSDQLFVVLNGTDAPPTPTVTRTPTRSATPTRTSTPTITPVPATATSTQTATSTISGTPTPTSTRTGTPTASPTPIGPGDANCDDRLDLLDIPALIERLFAAGCDRADANQDGRVSAADVTSLLRLLATRP